MSLVKETLTTRKGMLSVRRVRTGEVNGEINVVKIIDENF